eukprot:Awhi_evm2s14829
MPAMHWPFVGANELQRINLSGQWISSKKEIDLSKKIRFLLQNTPIDDLFEIGWYIVDECKLETSHNNIDDEGIGILLPALKDYDTLSVLVLTGNIIGAEGAEKIAHMLRENQSSIAQLFLGSNDIGVDG